MSLFDFIFPEVAQVQELRRIADSASLSAYQSKIAQARINQQKLPLEKRIQELENDVSQLTIVLEALIEKLCDKEQMTLEDLAAKVAEIDLRDGVADGKITKKVKEEHPKKGNKLIFPENQ